uniref:Uncharacterized protein n=1 Tax=Anguilla anguilla TaxID=7936 RepID=A0A0E9PR19_ANGAN
MHARSHTVRYD